MQRDKRKIAAAPYRLSWPAIFGGMFAAAGAWLVLHTFGLALGLSQLEPGDPSDLRATGIGGGIWTVLMSMISLFFGGLVTARAAGILGRSNAGLHGIVLWGVTTVGGLVLIVSVIASLARGVAGVAAQGAMASGSAIPGVSEMLGVEPSDLLGPVNARLKEQGKPTITVAQLNTALRDAASTSLRQGRFDREVFVSSMAEHTALTRDDVEELMGGVGQRLSTFGQNMLGAAERTATITGRAFWGLFGVMLLSLLSSVLGAIAGVTPRQRELSAQAAELTPVASVPRKADLIT